MKGAKLPKFQDLLKTVREGEAKLILRYGKHMISFLRQCP
jgi:hypothetical protein